MAARRHGRRAFAVILTALAVLAGLASTAVAAPSPTITSPAGGSWTKNQTPPFSGTTDDPLDPITLRIYSGGNAEGSLVQMSTIPPPLAETWETTPESLAEGEYTAVAEQSNVLETGKSGETTFTIDTTPPGLTLNSVSSPTKDATPTLTGKAGTEPGDIGTVTVKIYSGEVLVTEGAVKASSSSWTFTSPQLEDGSYTATAEQSDKAGNASLAGAPAFVVDTTPPSVTLNPLAAFVTSDTPTFTGGAGTAESDLPDVTLKIYHGTGTGGSLAQTLDTLASGGAWSATPGTGLTQGTYTAVAEQSDKAGNTGRSGTTTFTVVTGSPAVTLKPVTSPTNKSKPQFSGNAGTSEFDLATVTVKIYQGAGTGGTLEQTLETNQSSGSWSMTPTSPLGDGTYTAVAEQSNKAGTTGVSNTSTFTVDTTAPSVTLNPQPAFVTNATPTFTGGAGMAEFDVPAVTVKIYHGTGTGGSLAQTLKTEASFGSWNATPATGLGEGTYTAIAEQSDQAGNTGKSSTTTFTVVTGSPPVTLKPVSSPTNNAKPQFSGNAGSSEFDLPTVTVKIYQGTGTGGTLAQTLETKESGGSWSVTPASPLGDGTYTAVAEQSNEAGTKGVSTPATFTVDTTPPTVTLNALAPLISTGTPTFGGNAGTTARDLPTVKVKVYAGSSASGSPVQTLTASGAGGTWSASPASKLVDGTYTAIAEQSDEAANTGFSATTTFTVDTAVPKVTLKAVPALSNNTTPVLNGAAGTATHDLSTITVNIYAGTSAGGIPVQTLLAKASSGSWSAAPLPLTEGTYTAIAEQSNEAGITGSSSPSTFTVDVTPPSVSLNPLPPFVNTATPTLSGGAGTEAHDSPVVTVKIYAGTNTSGALEQTLLANASGGSWAATPAKALKEGTYTAIAEQPDEAGNRGTSTTTTFTVNTALPKVTLNAVAKVSQTQTPTFSGKAGVSENDLPTVTLNVYQGTSATGTPVRTLATAASSGSWSIGPIGALEEGTYTAIAEQSNKAGQTGQSIPSTFTILINPPEVTLNPLPPLTNKATPTFNGSAESTAEHALPTVKLKIYIGTSASGTLAQPPLEPKTSHGTWSATPTSPLTDGTYTAIAEQSDEAGNVGVSHATTFTVDTVAPAVTLKSLPPFTNQPAPTFSGGVGTALHDLELVRLKIFRGAGSGGELQQTVLATVGGSSWTASPTSPLTDGTYTAIAEQSDEAGNTRLSSPTTFTIDTVPPTVTLRPLAEITTSNKPGFEGTYSTAEPPDLPAVTVRIYVGTAPEGKLAQAPIKAKAAAGSWTATPPEPLPDGTYTAIANQPDQAGNIGKSGATTFTVKTTGPNVTLNALPTWVSTGSPTFSGHAGTEHGDLPNVTVKIYLGTSTTGSPAQALLTKASGGSWSVTASEGLPEATYTAVAEQSDEAHHAGVSKATTFTVVTTAPPVTITSPAEGAVTTASSQTVSGTAGTTPGLDRTEIAVQLFAGSGVAGPGLEKHTVDGSGGSWSTTFAGLAPGTYTVRAAQLDEAGNEGTSVRTFTVASPPPPPPKPPAPAPTAAPPPVASFTWLPGSPHVGETVTLISNSSDSAEAITALAWNAAGNGVFSPAGPVITTSFAKPGSYPVQLRVTSAAGLSSVASRTIPVTSVPLVLMQPFPVVRIVGYDTATGVTLRLLSVMTPVNSRVTVSCRGGGCPTRAESHLARASKPSLRPAAVLVTFRRFARPLRAGVTLQIRVAKPGQIGKYTRFTVRRGKLPTRVDSCLDPTGVKPIACPSP